MRLKSKWANASGEDWALVTGAAGGIGFAIAEKLAALGYNLALADINAAALRKAELDLYGRYGVHTRSVETDLSRPEAAGKLHDWCVGQKIEPVILINNAGVFIYNDIIKTDPERIETIVGLHVLTVSLLMRLFGGDMARRGRGWILNMSSYSVWMPWPGLSFYSATKSFIRNFSKSFAGEVGDKGVVVSVVLPAGVTTDLYGLSPKLQNFGKSMGVLLTPEKTAEVALAAMFRGRKQYVPGLFWRIVRPIAGILPNGAVRFLRKKTLRFQK